MDNIWQPKEPLKVSQQRVVNAVEKVFEPDLKVRVDEKWTITGFEAKTVLGANFLLRNAGKMLENSVDLISFGDLFVEYDCPEEIER